MASSRPTSSPETELRHWLQDLVIETSLEETGKEVKRTPTYCLAEVSVGGSLSAIAVKSNDRGVQNGAQNDEEDDANTTGKIAEECHRYAKLRHPNILQFIGVGFPKMSLLPVVVTERLDFTLSQCLSRFTNLPEYLRLSILLEVAQGLHFMHDNSPPIAHGELDATNVFLTPTFHAKISYPPIYKIFGSEMHDNGHDRFLGLQTSSAFTGFANSRGGSCKDDIFAYGELMTHVITQKKPRRVATGHSPSLLQQIEHVDSSHVLRGLIMQCLQKDPVLRPAAGEIVQEILMASSGQKSPFQDPIKILSMILEHPTKNGTSPKGSPTENKLKRMELENTRLIAQLKVTQSELRHLRMQQSFFGRGNMRDQEDQDDSDKEEEEEIEKKDASVQVEILQDSYHRVSLKNGAYTNVCVCYVLLSLNLCKEKENVCVNGCLDQSLKLCLNKAMSARLAGKHWVCMTNHTNSLGNWTDSFEYGYQWFLHYKG